MAGGLNLYGFANGDPINFSDPFGLCVPWCTAAAGAVAFGGIRLVANILGDRHFTEGVVQDALVGGLIGGTLGAGAPALVNRLSAGGATVAATSTAAAVPAASNPALQRTINQLFRAGDQIAGGTVGAIRFERATGQLVGGVSHIQKGFERAANLERIIRTQDLSADDLRTAQRLLGDVNDALRGLGRP